MITVWKYVLPSAVNDLPMPAGARVIHAHEQGGEVCIWAEVDPSAPRAMHRVLVAGTGHELPADWGSQLRRVRSPSRRGLRVPRLRQRRAMTKTQRENYRAMLYLTLATPFYILLHPRETRENWRNGRTQR